MVVFCSLLAAVGAVLRAQTLVDLYTFNGTYADSLGGPALTGNGAILGAGTLTFGPNQGPRFDGDASLAGNYSIGLQFSLSSINVDSGWQKLVDFQNLGADSGAYTYGQELQFVYVPGVTFENGTRPLPANATINVVFTRDGATNQFSAYLNGSTTPEYTFADTTGQAMASLVNGDARFIFFMDDTATGQAEAGAGVLEQIRIWNGPLSPDQIPTAFAAIPEPETGGLLLMALVSGWIARRRHGGRPGSGIRVVRFLG